MPDRDDLHAAARVSSEGLVSWAEAEGVDRRQVAGAVRERGRFVAAMSLGRLDDALRAGHLRSPREILATKLEAPVDDPAVERELQSRWGGHYRPRASFEARWRDGGRFVYGALSTDRRGPGRYGKWRVVASREAIHRPGYTTWIERDSARGFLTPDAELDWQALEQSLATTEAVPALCARKLGDPPADEVDRSLLGEDDYVEAVVVAGPRIDELERVTVPRAERDDLRRAELKVVLGAADPADRSAAELVRSVEGRCAELRVSIEELT